ncbi:MAG: hypothetical protein WAQ08_16055 [Aquabacterium sp.]|uniref:hypothetical protein n=1 Tax=Aquabacterium sp. TaxID=1872578 RepID=UPI003BB0029D
MSGGLIDKHRNADGTVDGLGVMADLTNRPRADMDALWAEVKANHAKLQACRRHDFVRPAGIVPINAKLTCRACDGWASPSDARWYDLGLAHASRYPAGQEGGSC